METPFALLVFDRDVHRWQVDFYYNGPVMRNVYIFFAVSLNKGLNKR